MPSYTQKQKNEVLEFCKRHGRRPSTVALDLNEKLLGQRCNHLTTVASDYFDRDFALKLLEFPTTQRFFMLKKKEEILAYCKARGHRPPGGRRATTSERKLATLMGGYTNPASNSYDYEFARKVSLFPVFRELDTAEAA